MSLVTVVSTFTILYVVAPTRRRPRRMYFFSRTIYNQQQVKSPCFSKTIYIFCRQDIFIAMTFLVDSIYY